MKNSDRDIPRKYAEIQSELKGADHKVKFVMYLFSEGPREYDFLLRVLSFGRDKYLRRTIIDKVATKRAKSSKEKQKILDIACGTGLVSFEFASNGMDVIGVDVTREMLVRAVALTRDNVRKSCQVDFIQARAENLPIRSDCFDSATISLATRNVSDVRETFSEMDRCVKPGGFVISMDFTKPQGRTFRQFYDFYIFNVLPALGLVISRHWNGIFSYLAASIRRSKTPEQIAAIMKLVGLDSPQISRMTWGTTALVSANKPENHGEGKMLSKT